VITYHGLTGYGLEPIKEEDHPELWTDPFAKLTRIYTIGSPLDKIRLYWPALVKRTIQSKIVFDMGRARRAESSRPVGRFEWHNFHNPLDLISDGLDGFTGWPGITNHRVWGGGLVLSHIIYEWNHEFLRVVTEGLYGTTTQSSRKPLRRAWTGILAFGESALALVLLCILMAVGVAFAYFAGWLFSSAAGWVAGRVSAGFGLAVKFWTLRVFLFGSIAAAITIGRKKAIEDHNRWAAISSEEFPATATAWFVSGFKKFQLRDRAGAREDIDRALEIAPAFARAHIQRGLIAAATKDYHGAIRDFTRAIELDPTLEVAYYGRGLMMMELNRPQEAIADLSRAIDIDAKYAEAYLERGRGQGALRRYAEAMKDFTAALRSDPTNDDAFYYRGVTRAKLGDHRGAIADFTRTVELNPRRATAYIARARSYAGTNDERAAELDVRKALTIDPTLGPDAAKDGPGPKA
jgi:tetratricopeptide (TPR) repeat protein